MNAEKRGSKPKNVMTWADAAQRLDHTRVPAFCAARWGCDPDSLTLVNLGINAVYRFTINGRGHYLRLSHAAIRRVDEWRAATEYNAHLAAQGVPVCEPVRARSGEWIALLQQDDLTYWGMVCTEVPGTLMHTDHADLHVYEAWGHSLGALHAAAKTFTPDPALPYKTIDGIWDNVRRLALPHTDAEIQAAFQAVDAWRRDLPFERSPGAFGLTHGDYRPGNVLWDGTTAHTVDFDEPVMHWFVSDIARVMLAFVEQPLARRRAVRDAFLMGYRSVTPLNALWEAHLGPFMQWRGLLMYLWTVEDMLAGEDELPVFRDWAVTRYGW